MNERLWIHKYCYPGLGAIYKVLYKPLFTCKVCVSIPFFSYKDHPVADLGEGPGGPGPTLILEEITEGRKAGGQAKQPLFSPLAQGPDPPLPLVQKRLHK